MPEIQLREKLLQDPYSYILPSINDCCNFINTVIFFKCQINDKTIIGGANAINSVGSGCGPELLLAQGIDRIGDRQLRLPDSFVIGKLTGIVRLAVVGFRGMTERNPVVGGLAGVPVPGQGSQVKIVHCGRRCSATGEKLIKHPKASPR